jgi:uncharacterized protein YraI
MNRARLFILGLGFGLTVAAVAAAQTAYTTKTVNMRAGPSHEYPLVARIPAGEAVEVGGCVDDWTWCDVGAGPDRGWVYAANLEYPYEDRRVTILTNGPIIGLPIVPFAVGTYWGRYYVGRPWYARRPYWESRPLAPHRPVAIVPPGPRPVGVRLAPRAPAPAPRAHAPAPAPRAHAPAPAPRAHTQAPAPRAHAAAPRGAKKPEH